MATGHVYMIETEEGPVKIGVAINSLERLKRLQTGAASRLRLAYVEPVLNGHAGEIERAAHQLLADRRAHGEWFNVTVLDARGAIAAATAGERARKPSSRPIRNKHLSGQVEMPPHLCRTARGILGWTRNDLAAATGLSAIWRAAHKDETSSRGKPTP
jgi:hypothetical protein